MTTRQCVVIDVDGEPAWLQLDPDRPLTDETKEALTELVRAARVRVRMGVDEVAPSQTMPVADVLDRIEKVYAALLAERDQMRGKVRLNPDISYYQGKVAAFTTAANHVYLLLKSIRTAYPPPELLEPGEPDPRD